MLEFRRVTKAYRTRGGPVTLIGDLTLHLPRGARIAILGRNGAGKSTLLGLAAGTVLPDGGHVRRRGRLSWPMGFAGGFAPDMTGEQNARFVARVYGVDTRALVAHVEEFAELGPYLRMPVRTYSAGMRARLAFGLSMGIAFDCYLVDEITAVGDAGFRQRALEAFETRLEDAGLLMVSHSFATLRQYCREALLLDGGRVTHFRDLDQGIRAYEALG